jgi:hypothetical protein
VTARRRRRRRVVGARAVTVAARLGAVGRIVGLAVVARRVGLRGRGARVVHGGLGGEDMSQRVSGVGLIGACGRFHGVGRCVVRPPRFGCWTDAAADEARMVHVARLVAVWARTGCNRADAGEDRDINCLDDEETASAPKLRR